MIENAKVHITYKDKNLKVILEKDYSLEEYTECLKASMLRILTDILDVFYDEQKYKSKSLWDAVAIFNFNKIKHKLLDCANDINRIPLNLYILE